MGQRSVQQLLAETEGIKATGDTVDAANAIASFAAKRTPQFEGSKKCRDR